MHAVGLQIAKENIPLLQEPIHMNSNKAKRSTNTEVNFIDIDFTTHVLFLETDSLLQIKEVYNQENISAHGPSLSKSTQVAFAHELSRESTPASISSESKHVNLFDQQYPIDLPDYLQGENLMSNVKEAMNAIMAIDGAMGVAIVDWNSGLTLGTQGSGLNLELAAAGNTNVVRAKHKVMRELGLKDSIEDILITCLLYTSRCV